MTGVSTLGQALNQIDLINEQNILLSRLTNQLATGRKTQKFSGLGTDLLTSKRTRADFRSLQTYSNNITIADRRIQSMLTSIEEFKTQTAIFADALANFSQQGVHQQGTEILYDDPLTTTIVETTKIGMTSAKSDVSFATLQDMANNIYDFMVNLVNTQDGDRYLFGGADTLTQPLVDGGTLDSAISSLISNWKDETLPAATNLTSTELISALQSRTSAQDPSAVTDSIIGYSSALSAGNVGNIFVRVDDKSEIEYTALGNDQSFRDILVAVSYFKNENLDPIADVFAEPYTLGDPTLADGAPGATLDEMKTNFYQVFNSMTAMVNQSLDDMDQVRFKLEGSRARLDKIQKSHTEERNVLLSTISNIENADINEVAVKVQALQIQLDASYRITALTGELSLVNLI